MKIHTVLDVGQDSIWPIMFAKLLTLIV